MPMKATWQKQGFEFRVEFPQGETLTLTSVPKEERPGPGPSPMDVVQASLATCTGMDVVLILQKMRKTLESFRVEVEPVRRQEHPRVFTRLDLTYYLEGPDLDAAAVCRAVHLSHEKYCSVSAMLSPTVEIGNRIFVNGKAVDPQTADA